MPHFQLSKLQPHQSQKHLQKPLPERFPHPVSVDFILIQLAQKCTTLIANASIHLTYWASITSPLSQTANLWTHKQLDHLRVKIALRGRITIPNKYTCLTCPINCNGTSHRRLPEPSLPKGHDLSSGKCQQILDSAALLTYFTLPTR